MQYTYFTKFDEYILRYIQLFFPCISVFPCMKGWKGYKIQFMLSFHRLNLFFTSRQRNQTRLWSSESNVCCDRQNNAPLYMYISRRHGHSSLPTVSIYFIIIVYLRCWRRQRKSMLKSNTLHPPPSISPHKKRERPPFNSLIIKKRRAWW